MVASGEAVPLPMRIKAYDYIILTLALKSVYLFRRLCGKGAHAEPLLVVGSKEYAEDEAECAKSHVYGEVDACRSSFTGVRREDRLYTWHYVGSAPHKGVINTEVASLGAWLLVLITIA